MHSISELPVLELAVLIDMYGDDSNETVVLALSGFNLEAQRYITQLQQAMNLARINGWTVTGRVWFDVANDDPALIASGPSIAAASACAATMFSVLPP